jgi:hypothetical protein
MSMNAVPEVAGGGEPPYDKEMDRRLTVLETRFDTILPTLATKNDLEALRAEVRVGFESIRREMEELRADVFKAINDAMRWMLGVVVSLIISVLAVNVALFNAVMNRLPPIPPSAPAVQQGTIPAPPPLVAPSRIPKQ